jgi:3-hydroxyisobutyrate dehydrogenase
MGSGMARRLLSFDFPLAVYNRSPEKCHAFSKAGAFVASSPRQAAERSEFIIGMLADDVASRGVWLGEEGALRGAAPGTVLIESSTLSLAWVRELGEHASRRDCPLLDAPVTGTKPHAASGELVFLVGGLAATLETARPVLAVLSRDIIHLGPPGSGASLKLINNFLCGVQAASLAEAMSLLAVTGVDRDKAVSVLTNGAPGSPLVKVLSARAAAGDFTPNFLLRLMAKDLSYALEEGRRHGLTLRTAESARAVFDQAVTAGLGDKDFSAVLEVDRRH